MDTNGWGDDAYERACAALAGHRPGSASPSLRPLGAGLDHAAFVTDGGLVVRAVRTDDDPAMAAGAYVAREAAVLATVGPLVPLPVPEVVFADTELAVLAYRLLPGRPLLDVGVDAVDNQTVARGLGRFLGALHGIPRDRVPDSVAVDDDPLVEWLDEASEHWAAIRSEVAEAHHPAIERFLAAPPPAQPDGSDLALCHADLGAEHILVDPDASTVTGIIDWTDAAITDPARDLGRLYRDLGPAAFATALDAYGAPLGDRLLDRTTFYARCTLLEDLAYGLRRREHRYSTAALTSLAGVFG